MKIWLPVEWSYIGTDIDKYFWWNNDVISKRISVDYCQIVVTGFYILYAPVIGVNGQTKFATTTDPKLVLHLRSISGTEVDHFIGLGGPDEDQLVSCS